MPMKISKQRDDLMLLEKLACQAVIQTRSKEGRRVAESLMYAILRITKDHYRENDEGMLCSALDDLAGRM